MCLSLRALIKGTGEQPSGCGVRGCWAHCQVGKVGEDSKKIPKNSTDCWGIMFFFPTPREAQVTLLVPGNLPVRWAAAPKGRFSERRDRPDSSAAGCCPHNPRSPPPPAGSPGQPRLSAPDSVGLLSTLRLEVKCGGWYPCHSPWWAPSQGCAREMESR